MNDMVDLDDGLLYWPDPAAIAKTQLHAFIGYCQEQTGRTFADYAAFDAYAASQFRDFWSLFLGWSQIICDGDREPVCDGDDCELAVFFPRLRLNYAENLLSAASEHALIGCHVDNSHVVDHTRMSRAALRDKVIRLARFLQRMGIEPGDRVAAIARNNIEVIIAALASAAIGAVFSSCAHDMGSTTILSRFQQLKPKLLFANCADESWDVGSLNERIHAVVAGLPSLTTVVTLDATLPTVPLAVYRLDQAIADQHSDGFIWQRFAFNHPLFILFSSGTTGAPKCIMHGAGGTLLEHIKEHRLHGDMRADDRLFFQTSCGWMMWNWQLSALACGTEVVVYDGPLQGPQTLWQIVARHRVTAFGTNPAYIQFAETMGYSPHDLDLSALREVLSTGSILYPKQFDWLVNQIGRIPVQSISGGTDILGCFVLGNPLLPVYRGQAQCRSLGLDVRSLPPEATIGELICANPFPSRPVGFYGAESSDRYHAAYFAEHPGVWTHGDLIEITRRGAVMHGRSDGILNIRGVRIGPAEIYRILQQIPVIIEAMAVEQYDEREAGGARLILLVVLRGGVTLDAALIVRIRTLLAEQGHSVMVPASIIQMTELPVTFSGKRSEAAARDAVNGRPVANRSALLNAACLDRLADKVVPAMTEMADAIEIDGDLEQRLCDMCRRHLNVPEITPTDDFLSFGGDSIVILGFLLEVVERTRTTCPLPTLVGVTTIRELAQRIKGGGAAIRGTARHLTPQVRPLTPDDHEQVYRLLEDGFRRVMPWQRILHHRWQPAAVPRGFVLTVAGEIVGFIGLIAATRMIRGQPVTICNLTSWYVRPALRGWSNALLAAALQVEGASFTSLTPGNASMKVLLAMGFVPFDMVKRFLPPLLHLTTLRGPPPVLMFDPRAFRSLLDSNQRADLDAHLQYDTLPMLLVDGTETAFMIMARRLYTRRGWPLFPFSEMLYCSAPALLYRHLERVKLATMWRQRTIGLLVSADAAPPLGVSIPDRTLFRSATLTAQDMDKLYSELALLPV